LYLRTLDETAWPARGVAHFHPEIVGTYAHRRVYMLSMMG
jgi:hypothetical protein